MSYFRSYFSKNNTIIKGSNVNTAKNPNTNIYYGAGFSKYIININLDELTNRVNNGDFVLNSDTKHYLHLTNTIFGDESLIWTPNGEDDVRATSFDLILFPINESWDEGIGFDYSNTGDIYGNRTYDLRPSNWYYKTSLDMWDQEGIYSTIPDSIITSVHFDNGNENLVADITDYVNNIVTGSTVNYGLGIAFDPDYMVITNSVNQSVSFFTKYTQTFFEPYLETVLLDTIDDNRDNFIAEIDRNIYIYVTKGTNYYDLDYLPTVDILDSTNTPISGLTGLTATKVRKGIYVITLGLSGQVCDGKKFFYDKWYNLYLDGILINPVTQKFVPKQYTSLYSIGENRTENERYTVQFFGIKLNEKIKRGNKRKVVVTFRSIYQQKPVLFEDVYYRIYIKEGHTQVNVFDWTKLDKTNENSFVIDTSYLIPREYNIEIKGNRHTEDIFYRDEIKFEIVSEK